mgnify:CR=1 FL=1
MASEIHLEHLGRLTFVPLRTRVQVGDRLHGRRTGQQARVAGILGTQQARGDRGDTLAEFIVREIADTFDATAATSEQIKTALDAMKWAAVELGSVISELERQLCADATGQAERKGDRHGR